METHNVRQGSRCVVWYFEVQRFMGWASCEVRSMTETFWVINLNYYYGLFVHCALPPLTGTNSSKMDRIYDSCVKVYLRKYCDKAAKR